MAPFVLLSFQVVLQSIPFCRYQIVSFNCGFFQECASSLDWEIVESTLGDTCLCSVTVCECSFERHTLHCLLLHCWLMVSHSFPPNEVIRLLTAFGHSQRVINYLINYFKSWRFFPSDCSVSSRAVCICTCGCTLSPLREMHGRQANTRIEGNATLSLHWLAQVSLANYRQHIDFPFWQSSFILLFLQFVCHLFALSLCLPSYFGHTHICVLSTLSLSTGSE